jgi:biopolymer transport protein ExbB
MSILKKFSLALGAAIVALSFQTQTPQAQEAKQTSDDAVTLQQLLDRVRDGRVRDQGFYKKREQEFLRDRNKQKALLDKTNAEIKAEEARSERLEKTFNENELKLAELEGLLNERLGVYGELFGIVRQVAGETRAQLDESIISGELPDRTAPLAKLSKTKGLPEMSQLEDLWFALQQEMTAQGQVKTYEGNIINLDGTVRSGTVTRVGPFTAISDGDFLRYSGDGRYADLGRQPPSRFGSAAGDIEDAEAGEIAAAVVDPSRGAILNLFMQMPTLGERINQGGLVGYVIIILGLLGAVLAVERIVTLSRTAKSVRQQLASGSAAGDSPLGRVWSAYESNKSADVETLELKLDDAILKEMPALERGLPLLKLLSGVAPLLGLLGTVTGMILTFQAITLFGTGDPKLMAGGISQALMTTVLGLVVAIPILLLHAVAATRSREVVQVLEEQAAGLIAAHAEKSGKR